MFLLLLKFSEIVDGVKRHHLKTAGDCMRVTWGSSGDEANVCIRVCRGRRLPAKTMRSYGGHLEDRVFSGVPRRQLRRLRTLRYMNVLDDPFRGVEQHGFGTAGDCVWGPGEPARA